MNTIRYFPGRKVTLYHYKRNREFAGVLYINSFTHRDDLFSILQNQLERLTEENLLLRISKVFLGLAVIGFTLVFFPPVYSAASNGFYRLVPSPKSAQHIPAVADIPITEEFSLEIPKINLSSTIIPNVDSDNEKSYLEKLKMGIAHAKGSYFPGDEGPIVLFSHSTDSLAHIVQYNAKFYALKDLEVGDAITINFKGKIYNYSVKDKKIIDPTNLNAIRQSDSKLILTTCWPPGTDWQRIAIFAS